MAYGVGEREALLAHLAEKKVPLGDQRVLEKCFEMGWVKGGPHAYYVVLEKRNAPSDNGTRRSSRSEKDGPFWGKGSLRQKLTRNALHACMHAGFLYVLEGDTPRRSVMGTVMDEASNRKIRNFGGQGSTAALHTIALSKDFVDGWNVGDICPRVLRATMGRNILAFDTLNEDIRRDAQTFRAIKSKKALDLVYNTRMGQMCITGKGVWMGSETDFIIRDGEGYGGSDVGSFAVNADRHTKPHIDTSQLWGSDWTDVIACAMVSPVQRTWTGPSKRAVVVSRDDREAVISLLGLDLTKSPQDQCKRQDIKVLSDLMAILEKVGIGYVVVDFPRLCSYVIPAGCMHMFFTMGLTETTTWFPILRPIFNGVVHHPSESFALDGGKPRKRAKV